MTQLPMDDQPSLRERLQHRGPLSPKTLLVFEVLLPPRQLSPNSRGHWARKLSPTRVYRREVGMLALSAMRKQNWTPNEHFAPSVLLEFNVTALKGDGLYRPKDVDNAVAAFKAGLDGMTDAGCWSDDSVVGNVNATIHRDSVELPGVTVWVYYGGEA